ncbi:hypothetical protein B0186_06585 [Canicola haemoglobinophilus]|uniref:Uncharacterized protein n=1 Tax=Canicola haemoglobinophilus TaxID=733 RepID=A0A1V4B0J7_9PAST|nr:hypothetical protein [Canicola haemoglobinophilus]OOS00028.1 hypothetical protein B0186_06585 [Canicola haemoglobinophilus]STO60882.1 Uncharacterised protein [Canicola haemoglobinophilus]
MITYTRHFRNSIIIFSYTLILQKKSLGTPYFSGSGKFLAIRFFVIMLFFVIRIVKRIVKIRCCKHIKTDKHERTQKEKARIKPYLIRVHFINAKENERKKRPQICDLSVFGAEERLELDHLKPYAIRVCYFKHCKVTPICTLKK